MHTRPQADKPQCFACPILPFPPGKSGIDHWQCHIFESRCTTKQIKALKDEADQLIAYIGQIVAREVTDAPTSKPIVTLGGMIQATKDELRSQIYNLENDLARERRQRRSL